jgi:SAM-dependent methyltransferase
MAQRTQKRVGPKMIAAWKIPHIIKGICSHVPIIYDLRARRAATGGTDSSAYCYRVWLGHLNALIEHGFEIDGARIGELGPGDSIGTGLAGLLCGAASYTGLDVFPYSAKADLRRMLRELAQKFADKEPISAGANLAEVFDHKKIHARFVTIDRELALNECKNQVIKYCAPWTSLDVIAESSLDLVFSHCVLEYVDRLFETYQTMHKWLKPGGFCSHHIAMNANHFSPFWNGHWAYSDLEWRLLQGRRHTVLNREPLSTHITCVKKAGFEILHMKRYSGRAGLDPAALSPRFRTLDSEDLKTRGALLILRKPS